MKPKVRKELKQNRLAEIVGSVVTTLRPYANYILYGVVIVLAVYLFVQWKSRKAEAKVQLAWASLFENLVVAPQMDMADRLGEVATNFPDSQAAGPALAQAGFMLYNRAADEFHERPEQAAIYLQKAEDHFKRVLERFGSAELAVKMSEWGLAYVCETRGDLAAARRQFQLVIDRYPQTAFAANSRQRLRALAEPGAAEFYAAATQAAVTTQPGATTTQTSTK